MRRNVVSGVVEKDGALLSGYKFQGSRVYPEYKDRCICFLSPFKTHFLQVVFFFFYKNERHTKSPFTNQRNKAI